MKKVLFLLAAIMATSGCVKYVRPDGTTQRVILYQVGVVVRVVNNCAPFIDLERVNGIVVKDLAYGQSATVPLVSTPFGGSNRQMPLIAKGYDELKEGKRPYLGSATRTFYANTYEGSREEVWEIDQLRLPNGRAGCH